ncbi:hypothetical protein V6N11_033204 [Hibiscus sabdariffa]|uniref:Uncharacterized protein n=1 Tax=Hibiscus sabdariffa TaxID=183260 RepID=A0ABR2PXE3_9ROSI
MASFQFAEGIHFFRCGGDDRMQCLPFKNSITNHQIHFQGLRQAPHLRLFQNLFHHCYLEFDKEKYQNSKVDPMAQFSKLAVVSY